MLRNCGLLPKKCGRTAAPFHRPQSSGCSVCAVAEDTTCGSVCAVPGQGCSWTFVTGAPQLLSLHQSKLQQAQHVTTARSAPRTGPGKFCAQGPLCIAAATSGTVPRLQQPAHGQQRCALARSGPGPAQAHARGAPPAPRRRRFVRARRGGSAPPTLSSLLACSANSPRPPAQPDSPARLQALAQEWAPYGTFGTEERAPSHSALPERCVPACPGPSSSAGPCAIAGLAGSASIPRPAMGGSWAVAGAGPWAPDGGASLAWCPGGLPAAAAAHTRCPGRSCRRRGSVLRPACRPWPCGPGWPATSWAPDTPASAAAPGWTAGVGGQHCWQTLQQALTCTQTPCSCCPAYTRCAGSSCWYCSCTCSGRAFQSSAAVLQHLHGGSSCCLHGVCGK